MTQDILLVEIAHDVATLTMNRPGKRNAMCDELLTALDRFFVKPPKGVKAITVQVLIFQSTRAAMRKAQCAIHAIGTLSWIGSNMAVCQWYQRWKVQ